MTDDDDIVRHLRDAYAELRTLPLGGRGHLADVCHEGAGEITELRAEVERLRAALAVVEAAQLRGEVPASVIRDIRGKLNGGT